VTKCQPNDDDAVKPYSVAKGYVQAAFALMANPLRMEQLPDDIPLFMAFHMLCGFAVELYLKAFLLHKGFSETSLRKPDIRHDLIKLQQMCVAEGLHEAGSKSLAEGFGTHHKSFEYRYMKPDTVYRTAPLHDIFSTFSLLDNAVDEAIGASVSRGKTPGGTWSFPTDKPWRLPGL
jgi:hypothetical protein